MSKISNNKYNPWEDKRTFVQNVGNTQSILDIISSEGIDICPSMPDFSKTQNIPINNQNQSSNDNNNNINEEEKDNENSKTNEKGNENPNIANTNIFTFKESSILPLITQNEYSTTESIIDALDKLYEYNTIQYNKL